MAETQTQAVSQDTDAPEPVVSETTGDVKQESLLSEADTEAEPEAEPKPEPEGAPETYEFQAPEGTTLDDKVLETFSEVARELNLTQDAAQSIIDKLAPVMDARAAENLQARLEQQSVEWRELTTKDKELGGESMKQRLAIARKALDRFGTEELHSMLNEHGLGNHPEIIRWAYRVGKAISEDTLVTAHSPAVEEVDLNDPEVQKRVFYKTKE